MAETKPTRVPRWNEGGSNRTEPPETGSKSKTTGWAVDDEPPSSYFNWLQYYTGAFLKWINERMFDGSNARDFTVQSVQGTVGEDGGELFLLAEDGNTNANGGIVRINTGDGGATSGSGGSFIVECGDAPTDGWGGSIVMNAGDDAGGYFGGNVTIQSGDSATASGGNFTINAGDGDDGGDVSINGGDGVGAAHGGDIVLTGGQGGTTPGYGGDIILTGGDGRNLEGGDIIITSGSVIQGPGGAGDIILQGGLAIDAEGGNIDLIAGNTSGTTGGTGGDITAVGGNAVGTNKDGGYIDLKAGDSTGTGYSGIDFFAAEAGVSGSGVNTSERFFRVRGGQGTVASYKQHEFLSSQSDRGHVLFNQKAEPTSPVVGDVYMDSATDQLNIHNGTRYHAINPLVHVLDSSGTSRTGAGSTFPYYQHYKKSDGTTDIAYLIPANTLRVGTKINCEIYTSQIASTTVPSVISINPTLMADPSYVLPVWYSFLFTGDLTASNFDYTHSKVSIVVRTTGPSAQLFFVQNSTMVLNPISTTPATYASQGWGSFSTINTTVNNYIFPFVYWLGAAAVGDSVRCVQFFVEVT